MPTVIGGAFFILGFYCVLHRKDWLFGLLLFSSIFLASSWINIGDNGIQVYYLIACCFLFRSLPRCFTTASNSGFKGKYLLVTFAVIGVASAMVLPGIFAGIPVYPRDGLDTGFLYRPPLHFGLSNAAQAVYLIINCLVVMSAAVWPYNKTIENAYRFTFYFLFSLIVVQFVCVQYGVGFPYSLLQNNPGYYLANVSEQDTAARVFGTFTEPSGAGAALVFFYAGFLEQFLSRKRSPVPLCLALMAIGMVRSGATIAAAAAVTLLLLFSKPFLRYPCKLRVRPFVALLSIVSVLACIAFTPLKETFTAYTLDKADTVSYIHRTAADLHALRIAADSHWIGVGLGSNRSSSLLTCLLSNMGPVGLSLFLFLVLQISRNARVQYSWMRWSILALIIDAAFGIPDITLPTIWVALAFAVHVRNASEAEGAIPEAKRTQQPSWTTSREQLAF